MSKTLSKILRQLVASQSNAICAWASCLLSDYVNHVHIAHCLQLIDCGINLYIQKEQLILLDDEGHPSLFAPIMIATLSTCAQLERDNISIDVETFRLSHDRFLCIDDDVYHIGASIKDLGKKWFGFSKMEILTSDELVERINRE